MAEGKLLTVARLQPDLHETSTEAEARRAGNFDDVEGKLHALWPSDEVGFVEKTTAFFGLPHPFKKTANPKDNKVWLLDNTAYRPSRSHHLSPQPWQAEYVACFFRTGRREIGEVVANIAEQIGLDDKPGPDHEARKRIEERRYRASYFPCPPGKKGSAVLPCYLVRLKFLAC